ncbi:MAG: hypothetical protein M3444_12030 [Acidobacteriota bacterium]|nr:hypothetical protein [Acidobacteriota bacterium]MDQ5836320.1 hypothetical protein [Acidobacteriota bacterium]
MSSETEYNQALRTGVQISSELLIPGGSNLVKGDIRQAGIHAGLSLIARVLFGLPGAALVSINSVTKAITGQHLHEHLTALTGTQAQRARTTVPRKAAKRPTSQTTPPDAPTAPDGVTLTSTEKPRPAKRPRTKSATKRRKASGVD